MTKEEAIKMLEYIKHTGNGESEYKNCAQSIAIDMAIKALEQEPCEDCVSRKEVFETIDDCNSDGLKGIFCSYNDGERFKEYIKKLPSVTPKRKTGKWVEEWDKDHFVRLAYKCSECGWFMNINTSHYCPNCGVKMRENEED